MMEREKGRERKGSSNVRMEDDEMGGGVGEDLVPVEEHAACCSHGTWFLEVADGNGEFGGVGFNEGGEDGVWIGSKEVDGLEFGGELLGASFDVVIDHGKTCKREERLWDVERYWTESSASCFCSYEDEDIDFYIVNVEGFHLRVGGGVLDLSLLLL